jgi:ligand-binding SRPBCC domain-containing protein
MHILKKTTWIPTTIEKAWNFFSLPENLEKITPANMCFKILDQSDSKEMFAGQIIQYDVTVLWKIRVRWVTEISHVSKGQFFVDEQRFGPYSFWHHKHFFYEENSGVKMVDIIHYKLPFGFLGRIIERFVVRPKLDFIFAFREQAIKHLF